MWISGVVILYTNAHYRASFLFKFLNYIAKRTFKAERKVIIQLGSFTYNFAVTGEYIDSIFLSS